MNIRQYKTNSFELKELAHDLLLEAFKNNYLAYRWLENNTSTGHFATMPMSEIKQVISKLKGMRKFYVKSIQNKNYKKISAGAYDKQKPKPAW